MNLVEFLQSLSLKGVKLWTEDGQLCSRGPQEVLTHDVIAQLKQCKIEILHLLRDRPDILNVYYPSYGQTELPKLPLPSLAETCLRYLEIVTPFLTPEERAKTERAVTEFLQDRGSHLQRLLEIYNATTSTSYVHIFRENQYLANREPLPNQNFSILFEMPLEMRNITWFRQIAFVSYAILNFYQKISSNTLVRDTLGNLSLCMSQYNQLFRTNRIPKLSQDMLHVSSHSLSTEHFIVLYQGVFYVITVDLTKESTLIDYIEDQIRQIVDFPDQLEPPVGFLTALNRSTWAVLRPALAASNSEALETLDTALFILCVDDENPHTLEEWSRQIMYGKGRNRWFDKTLQFIVTNREKWGLNVEHTPVDGITILRLLSDVENQLKDLLNYQVPVRTNIEKKSPPSKLSWIISPSIKNALREAELNFNVLAEQLEIRNVCIAGLGEDLMFFHRVPDNLEAIIHLILQLAYMRCHGRIDNVYQPIATRHFHYGRTEVMRPVTVESLHLIQLFEQGESLSVLRSALDQALTVYTKRKNLCVNGYGVDRHLYVLHELALQNNKVPDIFQDKAYREVLTQNSLSVSGFTVSLLAKLGGYKNDTQGYLPKGIFAPEVPDGYGISYVTNHDLTSFLVTSWSQSLDKFIQCLHQSALDIMTLLQYSAIPSSEDCESEKCGVFPRDAQ